VHAVVCVDVGSTFTKGAAVDVDFGDLLATASYPTTIAADVMTGVRAVLDEIATKLPGVDTSEVIGCSSAGGGLRLAVVGYERAVTAEAGQRVGLSAGARVVHVSVGRLDDAGLAALAADRPDVVLLVGGTDGGNSEVLLHNARALAGLPGLPSAAGDAAGVPVGVCVGAPLGAPVGAAVGAPVGGAPVGVPVVVAGNADASSEAVGLLAGAGWAAIPAANVLPRIGVLDPLPARAAIREVFIAHVIGGKHLSGSPAFAAMIRAATPDAVLTGVELLADGYGAVAGVGDVVVVDVGGATTDVYSVLTPDPEEAAMHREVVEVMWRGRTVEGDLGVRWSAPGVLQAGAAEHLVDAVEAADLEGPVRARLAEPDLVATDRSGRAVDARLAELALTVALRRHARPQLSGEVRHPGKDLRQVRLVVGSGGVLRYAEPAALNRILAPALGDHAGGWKVPEGAALAVDAQYVLAAAGLLAGSYPQAAARLVTRALVRLGDPGPGPGL
jgi:MutL protein